LLSAAADAISIAALYFGLFQPPPLSLPIYFAIRHDADADAAFIFRHRHARRYHDAIIAAALMLRHYADVSPALIFSEPIIAAAITERHYAISLACLCLIAITIISPRFIAADVY